MEDLCKEVTYKKVIKDEIIGSKRSINSIYQLIIQIRSSDKYAQIELSYRLKLLIHKFKSLSE